MKHPESKRFLFNTLRGRIILGVALVHAVMMSLFIIDLTIRQRKALEDRLVEETTNIAKSLSTSAAVWIVSDDVSGLQELIKSIHHYPYLQFAILMDENGFILAHTDETKLGHYFQYLPKQTHHPALIKTKELVMVTAPSLLGNQPIGWVCVGVNNKSSNTKIAELVLEGALYAIVAILIGSLIAWWIGSLFTRRINAIQQTMNEVRSGNWTARSYLKGSDEAASMSLEFNNLLNTLEEHRTSLVNSEKKYQQLLMSIRVGVIVHGADTKIRISNTMAQKTLGLSSDQLYGLSSINPNWHFLNEDRSIMAVEDYPVNRTLAQQKSINELILGVSHPNGDSITWVLVSTELVFDNQHQPDEVIVTFVDISKRKLAQESLHQLNRKLHAISACNQLLVHAEDESTLLKEVCRIICEETGYRLAWVGFALQDDAKTILPVAWSGFDSDYIANAKLSWSADSERGMGPAGESIRSGKYSYIPDLLGETSMSPWREDLQKRGFKSGIALPLKDERANAFGTLLIYSSEVNAMSRDEIQLLEDLTGDLAFGIVTLRNRKERQYVDEKLTLLNERFTLATHASHIGVWDWDLERNELIWDDKMYELYGISRDDFGGAYEAWLNGVHPDDRAASDEISRLSRLGKVEYDTAFRVIWPDGSVHHLKAYALLVSDANNLPCRMIGVNFDITDIKQTEEALKLSETKLKEAQHIAHIGSWELDIKKDVLTWSDEIFQIFEIDSKMFGASYEAFLDAIHPEDREYVNQAYTDSLNNKKPYVIDHRLLFEGGRIKYLREQCETFYDSEGKPIRSLGVVQDITKQKQSELEIQKLNRDLEKRVLERTAQLEAANKELEAFAYSVSHDLRAPLRGIDGFSQVLLEEYMHCLDENGQNYLQRIRLGAQRMAQLIDDMLNLSRVNRSNFESKQIDFSALVETVAEDLRQLQPNRHVEFIIQKGIFVHGDERLLRIALVNLLGNAWKFTSNHPTARIEFGRIVEHDVPVFYIQDDGAGFNMRYSEKLFGAFQRLHNTSEFPGTGIGLATVQRIIHRHGGAIWAKGEVEKGATIYFTIP